MADVKEERHLAKKAELYYPRKCSATNRLIAAKDHASVQVNIGHVDAHGVYTGEYTTFAFSGSLRSRGESDHALNRLAASKGLMKDILSFTEHHKYADEEAQ